MKKFLFWTALASVALTGCVKNDVEPNPSLGQDVEITFNQPVVGKVTKANVFNEIGTTYHKDETFMVTAWSHLKSKGSYDPANATVYIDHKEASYTSTPTVDDAIAADAGTGSWHFDPIYYWPKTHYLTFSAVSPCNFTAASKVIDATNGIILDDVEIPTDLDAQFDLMYSNRVFNQTESNYKHENSSYLGVDLQFHHALASIWVKVKMDESYPEANNQITINEIWLNDVYMKADFAEGLTTGKETDSKAHASVKWSDFKDVQDNITIGDTDLAIDDDTEKRYGSFAALLIPQVMEKAGEKKTTLNVTYTITNPGGTTIEETQSFELSKQKISGTETAIDQWQEGKRYTYTITFGLNEIYLAPAVDDWTDVNSGITI